MEPIFVIDTIHDLPVHNEFRTGYSKANTSHNLLWILTALILLYYGTGAQVRQLEWKTGVRFYSSFQLSMGF